MSSNNGMATMNGDEAARSMWREQRIWSTAANRLKKSIVRWRVIALALTILGAVLVAVSAVVVDLSSVAGRAIGIAGAASLAFVPVIRTQKLGHERIRDWTRIRSVS